MVAIEEAGREGVRRRLPEPAAVTGFLARCLLAERERWPLWSPVLFGAGIAIYFALPVEPSAWLGATLFGMAAVLAVVLLRRASALAIVSLAVALTTAGFTAASVRTAMVAAPVLQYGFGPAIVTGTVAMVEERPEGPRVILERPHLPGLAHAETPERVRVRLHRGSEVAVGQRIAVLARLDAPPGPSAPGAYDFRMQAWFAGIGGVGFALGKPRALIEEGAVRPVERLRLGIAGLRHAVASRIRASLPGESGAVAAALIVGDRSAIPAATMESIRHSGLAHLLAISGLHMGLVAATIFFAGRALLALWEPVALAYPIKKYAAAAAMLGGFAYLLLSGVTVPTQRAFLMTGLVLTAVLLDREAISMRLVAWAAIAILAVSPESLLGPSFQMSFAAVIALVALYEVVRLGSMVPIGRLHWYSRVVLYLAAVALTTLVAGAATGIFALHHFGEVAVYSIAANLVAVPITALWIMPWAVVGVLLLPLGLEGIGLVPMAWGIDTVLAVAAGVSSWPGAVVQWPLMPGWGVAAAALGGLWLCLWRRRWRFAGLAGIALGLASIVLTPRPDLLIAGSGKLAGLRLDDRTLALSTLRAERFTAGIWRRELGLAASRDWHAADDGPSIAACDALGCILRHKGRTIAIASDARALAEDCALADVVVALEPAKGRCASARVLIDRFDLWREGAHAVRLDTLAVDTVSRRAGHRPWTGPDRGLRRPARTLQ